MRENVEGDEHMSLTESQKVELNRVCGMLDGLVKGLAFAEMFNASGLQDALIECEAHIENVLNEPGEPVEELLKGVK